MLNLFKQAKNSICHVQPKDLKTFQNVTKYET